MVDRLLRAKDVAELLNISRSQAGAMMRTGVIPSVRFGRSIRVTLQDLTKFIETSKIQQPESYSRDRHD